MKKVLFSLALLATLSTLSFANDTNKGNKSGKARKKAKTESCTDKDAGGPSCCKKKAVA